MRQKKFFAEQGDAYAASDISNLERRLPVVEGANPDLLDARAGYLPKAALPYLGKHIILFVLVSKVSTAISIVKKIFNNRKGPLLLLTSISCAAGLVPLNTHAGKRFGNVHFPFDLIHLMDSAVSVWFKGDFTCILEHKSMRQHCKNE
ncbi:hypothetical protein [Shouchella clausii]|uniref:hypothetical protein n=1 Tax=Shouchella clausii TaxID=79880 RepID=UPI002868FED7|nr:hypothetical protein [Shouchella clausii]